MLQVSVDPVISTSSRISEGSTGSSRHSIGVSNHGNMRDDLMITLKSPEQEHQRLLSSHYQTEVAAICDCAIGVLHTIYGQVLLGFPHASLLPCLPVQVKWLLNV